MNRLFVTGKPQHSRLLFPPYTKHFFNVLFFTRASVRLYLPNDGVYLFGMSKHNEVSNSLSGG